MEWSDGGRNMWWFSPEKKKLKLYFIRLNVIKIKINLILLV